MEAILIPVHPHRASTGLAPDVDHARLVVEARSGDPGASEALLVLCRRTAFLAALQLLGNREDAMDVAQDALIRLVTSLDRFDVTRPLKPWVITIVRHLVIDLSRRRRVRRADSLEALLAEGGSEPRDGSVSPEQSAEHEEVRRRVARAVSHLPPLHREVIVLRDYQDLSYDEMARILGIPRGTVMSRLHRARSLLRDGLSEYHSGKGGRT